MTAAFLESVCRDILHTLRVLARRPVFSAVAVLTIAIGLGAMTVAFTGVNSLVFGAQERLALPGGGWVFVDERGQTEGEATFREYEAFVRDVPSLDIAASTIIAMSQRQGGRAQLVYGLAVSSNYFDLLEATAAHGRTFGPASEGTSVVVSDRYWRERLGRAPLTGLTINLNGLDVPVAGVLPDGHRRSPYDPSVWVRFEDWDALGLSPEARGPNARSFPLIGRLRAGATRALADSQLHAVSKELASAWPDTNARRTASFTPFEEGTPELRAIGRAMSVAFGMIGIVLLIAVFNLVGLLLARAVDREREMSLRGALGAGRTRLARQLVTESLVIAGLGGALALLVARFSHVLLRQFAMQAPIPQRIPLDVDWRVAAFTGTLVIASGVLAGLAPAWRTWRLRPMSVIGPSGVIGGARASRLRSLVVGLQLAGATMLLTMAALLVRNALLDVGKDVGFERERAVLVELFPANHGYAGASAQRFVLDALDRVRGLPGVVAASVADRIPFYIGFKQQMEVAIDGTPCDAGTCPTVAIERAGPDYFRAMNIPLVRGREFDGSPADELSVVVSNTTADLLWPSSDPIGRWISLGGGSRRAQVIGVAADVLHRGLGERPEPYIYLSLDRNAFSAPVTLVVRTSSDPAPLLAAADAQIRAMDPTLPIMSLQTMEQRLDGRARAGGRIVARFFLICGGLGLFLSIVGLVGTVSYSVKQRTRELGLRAAIGASPGDLGRLVVTRDLSVAFIGIVAGSTVAFGLTRVIRLGVSGLDLDSPLMFLIVVLLQIAIAVAAAVLPGRSAARVDPLTALRAE